MRVYRSAWRQRTDMSHYDLCLVYNDDADQWSRYVVHHLGREQFRFRLLPVTDRQLLDWLMTSRDGGATATCLREASEARSFIVVVSPGLVKLMSDHSRLDFHQLIDDPRKAQVGLYICMQKCNFFLVACTKARFPFKRNRLRCVRCVRCVNENRKKRKRLCFLRFSFMQRTQRTQRKRLRLNGNRA